jgi:antitoxin (DNA-binding transcriptional repressor) of toxin-antitoxin stability system
MAESITQRELRNESGEIMRRLDQGESFVVTRNGVRSVSSLPCGATDSCRRRPSLPSSGMRPPSTLAASVPMWMRGLARTLYPMSDQRLARGLLDTSVVIDLEHIEPSRLPIEVALCRAAGNSRRAASAR